MFYDVVLEQHEAVEYVRMQRLAQLLWEPAGMLVLTCANDLSQCVVVWLESSGQPAGHVYDQIVHCHLQKFPSGLIRHCRWHILHVRTYPLPRYCYCYLNLHDNELRLVHLLGVDAVVRIELPMSARV